MTLADVGFSRWDETGAKRKQDLKQMVEDAYAGSQLELIKIAASYGQRVVARYRGVVSETRLFPKFPVEGVPHVHMCIEGK